jgi:hypothetical protein
MSGALVVETDTDPVRLTADLAAAAETARRNGLVLQLVTPAGSRLSHPLELLLIEGGGQWIVPDTDGHRDGLTGTAQRWAGDRFVPDERPPAGPDFTRPPTGGVELQITAVHPVDGAALGATAEAAGRALVGVPPAGWGPAEPVAHPWSRAALTAFCADRLPRPTALVVVGGAGGRRIAGRLLVERVPSGLREELRLAGPQLAAAADGALDQLADEVGAVARSMLVAVHPTRTDTLRPAGAVPPPLPLALLAGALRPPAGADLVRTSPVPARLIDTGAGRQGCWWWLDRGPAAPFELLSTVLARLPTRATPSRPTGPTWSGSRALDAGELPRDLHG